jgi:hypothetical protein
MTHKDKKVFIKKFSNFDRTLNAAAAAAARSNALPEPYDLAHFFLCLYARSLFIFVHGLCNNSFSISLR